MNYYIIIYNLNYAEATTVTLNIRSMLGIEADAFRYDCYDPETYLVLVKVLDANFNYKDWERNHKDKRKLLISAARAHWSSKIDYYITNNEELVDDLMQCLR